MLKTRFSPLRILSVCLRTGVRERHPEKGFEVNDIVVTTYNTNSHATYYLDQHSGRAGAELSENMPFFLVLSQSQEDTCTPTYLRPTCMSAKVVRVMHV